MKAYQLGVYEKAMPAQVEWQERLSEGRRAGFDFVEISIDESEERQARLHWSGGQRDKLWNMAQAANLPIRTMCLSGHRKYPLGSHDAQIRARGMEIMEQAIELACDLGVRIIQLAGYDVYYEQGDSETQAYFTENLEKCVQLAAAYGVLMGFETMETPFMDTISKAMYYVKKVHSPYLCIYPDLGNLTNAVHLYGLRLADEFAAGSGHIVAMHIKETDEGRYRDLRFGEGRVDFLEGIRLARAQGVHFFVAECWDDGRKNWQEGLSQINHAARLFFR